MVLFFTFSNYVLSTGEGTTGSTAVLEMST